MLNEQQGQTLLRLVRQEIELKLSLMPTNPVAADDCNDPALKVKRGVFVTLHKQGDLRGCIGSLRPSETILDGINRHALNAAFADSRFPPVSPEELADLHIEISVLTPATPLNYTDGDNLVSLLRPQIDGVILQAPGGQSATFLPQVWKQLPTTEQFLDHLCLKAGLAEDTWRHGQLEIQTYQVQHFEEPRLPGFNV